MPELTEEELKAKLEEAAKAAVENYEANVSKPAIAKLEANNKSLLEEKKSQGEKLEAIKGLSTDAIAFMQSESGQKIFDKIGKADPKVIMQGIDLAKRLKEDGSLDDNPNIDKIVEASVQEAVAKYSEKHKTELEGVNKLKEEAEKKAAEAVSQLNNSTITTQLQTALLEAKAIPSATADFISAQIALGKIRINEETKKFEVLDDKGEVVLTKDAANHGQPMGVEEYSKQLQESKPYLFGKTEGSNNLGGGATNNGPSDPDFDPLAEDVDPAKFIQWANANPDDYQRYKSEGKI